MQVFSRAKTPAWQLLENPGWFVCSYVIISFANYYNPKRTHRAMELTSPPSSPTTYSGPEPGSPEQVEAIIAELRRLYPDAKCTLNFSNPLELLIATQLAAQCTDERVNIVTKDL